MRLVNGEERTVPRDVGYHARWDRPLTYDSESARN